MGSAIMSLSRARRRRRGEGEGQQRASHDFVFTLPGNWPQRSRSGPAYHIGIGTDGLLDNFGQKIDCRTRAAYGWPILVDIAARRKNPPAELEKLGNINHISEASPRVGSQRRL